MNKRQLELRNIGYDLFQFLDQLPFHFCAAKFFNASQEVFTVYIFNSFLIFPRMSNS